MRAAVLHGPGDLRLQDVTDPELGADTAAVVRVEAAGVCAADRYLLSGDHPWPGVRFPLVPGHEWVGVVETVTDEAGSRWGVQTGDRVTAEVMVACGRCGSCARGRTNLCRAGAHLGSDLPGAWADRVALNAQAAVHRLPVDLDVVRAALVEPVSCGVHAVTRGDIGSDDTVVVSGLGAVGGAAVLAARQRGARVVAAVVSTEQGLIASALGADAAVDVRAVDDPVAALLAVAGDVDVHVETSGDTAAVGTALDVVRPGGTVVVYGVYRRSSQRSWPSVWNAVAEFKELTIRGGHLSPGAWPEAVDIVSDLALPVHLLIGDVIPLADAPAALAPSAALVPPAAPVGTSWRRGRTVLVPDPRLVPAGAA